MLEDPLVKQSEIETARMDVKPSVGSRTEKIDSLEHELGLYKKRYNLVLQIAVSAACVLLLIFIVSYAWWDLSWYFSFYIKPPLARYWPNTLGVLIVFGLAFYLYFFRNFRRAYFGVAEVVFGIGLGWYGFNKAIDRSVEEGSVIILAALYIIGRGLVNWDLLLRYGRGGDTGNES